jgi:hypothetical protein
MKSKFDQIVNDMKSIYSDYHPEDVIEYLFCIFMWLPNISAVVKVEFAYCIFLTMQADTFQEKRRNTYSQFKMFYLKLVNNMPNFYGIEDFVPELDWGDISYYINDRFRKILYGGNSGSTYDYIVLFQLLHFPFSADYNEKFRERPEVALDDTLSFVDNLIKQIPQSGIDPDSVIEPGHLELPEEVFWEDCRKFINKYKTEELKYSYLGKNSISLGDLSIDCLNEESFFELVSNGPVSNAMSVNINGNLYPLIVRNYVHNLFNSWGKRLFDIRGAIIGDAFSRIAFSFSHFLSKIMPNVQILPLVEISGLPYVFAFAISGNDHLVLVHIYNIFETPDLTDLFENFNPNEVDLQTLHVLGHEVTYGSVEESLEVGVDLTIISLVIPLNSHSVAYKRPRNKSVKVLFSIDFLGIISSLDSIDEIIEFFEFQKSEGALVHSFSASQIDLFAAFVQSNGIITRGAIEYDFIGIDPIGGSSFRYVLVKEFYYRYPQFKELGDPLYWRIGDSGFSGIESLERKNKREICYSINLPSLKVAVIVSFDKLNHEDAKIINMIGECLIYNINSYSADIINLPLRGLENVIVVQVITGAILKAWMFEAGEPIKMECSIESLFAILNEPPNREFENKLLIDFISCAYDYEVEDSDRLGKKLDRDKKNPTGFKFFRQDAKYDFPAISKNFTLAERSKMIASKKIAEICLQESFQPGMHRGEHIKDVLNKIIYFLVKDLDSELINYQFVDLIEIILKESENIYNQYKNVEARVMSSKSQHVDYIREEELANKRAAFLEFHRVFRYLLAKVVFLAPVGGQELTDRAFSIIFAKALNTLSLYNSSDNMHYASIDGYELEITGDYTVLLHMSAENQIKTKRLHDKIATERIYRDENVLRSSDAITDIDKYRERLNDAFVKDFGFSATSFIVVLDFLRFYPSETNMENFRYYVADEKSNIIQNICIGTGYDKSEVELIMDFLLLKPTEVKTLLSDSKEGISEQNDIPIWEYSKRYSRPEIRPLIQVGNKLYFGTGATYTAFGIWNESIIRFFPPYLMKSKNVSRIFSDAEKALQDHLVEVAYQIVSKITKHLEKEKELHKLGDNFDNVGDVDVFALILEKKVILNLECKYIRDSFCIKDAKRDRDKIFFGRTKEKSYLEKVKLRETWLTSNKKIVLEYFGQGMIDSEDFCIKSLFVMNNYNYWTINPPVETGIDIVYIEDLEEYLLKAYQ